MLKTVKKELKVTKTMNYFEAEASLVITINMALILF
jgi:hypothetical protein